MTPDRSELRALAAALADPERPRATLIQEAGALRMLLERCTGLSLEQQPDLGANQTRLGAGLAISPIKAALCAREPYRTITFIKGLADAIAAARRPDRPVRVLYAGCGPFATLALPLMALLGPAQAVFTLVDIHAESLACAGALVDGLGLSASVAEYLLADACSMRLAPDRLPDVIVSETMNAALRSEPQVTIARNLSAQAPQALLVPQSVTVDACLLRLGKEFAPPLAAPDASPQEAQRERIALGPVFELSAAAIAAWPATARDLLPAGAIVLPPEVPAGMQPRLLTRIVVFGPHRLDDYDSSLNLPQHLPGRLQLAGGERLRFAYRLDAEPGLALV